MNIDHTNYPKTLKGKSIESLRYIIGDCKAVLEVNPYGSKAGYYADEINYCAMELAARAKAEAAA